jgi:hypothetical protein
VYEREAATVSAFTSTHIAADNYMRGLRRAGQGEGNHSPNSAAYQSRNALVTERSRYGKALTRSGHSTRCPECFCHAFFSWVSIEPADAAGSNRILEHSAVRRVSSWEPRPLQLTLSAVPPAKPMAKTDHQDTLPTPSIFELEPSPAKPSPSPHSMHRCLQTAGFATGPRRLAQRLALFAPRARPLPRCCNTRRHRRIIDTSRSPPPPLRPCRPTRDPSP